MYPRRLLLSTQTQSLNYLWDDLPNLCLEVVTFNGILVLNICFMSDSKDYGEQRLCRDHVDVLGP